MKNILRMVDQKGLSILVLMFSDVFWYFISFAVAYYVRDTFGPSRIQQLDFYLRAIPYVFILLIFIFYFYGLYDRKQRVNKIGEMLLVTKAASFTLLLLMAGSFLEKVDYSRAVVLIFWPISIFFLNFGRYLIRIVKAKLVKRGYGVMNILIIGAGKPGRRLARKLEEYKDFGYNIIGFLDDHMKPRKGLYKFLGQTKSLHDVIKKRNIHQVFIADPALSHEKILELINISENLPVKFKVISDLFEIIAGGIDMNALEEIPAIDLTKDRSNIVYIFMKRVIDMVTSVFVLVLFSPLWGFIALLIKIDSSGPVIFSHNRVGQGGKLFKIYKFRTMFKETASEENAPKSIGDKRVTRAGRTLRKMSLDEIPQFWNVLKGEMSIVGPRPEMPFITEKYTAWQKKRLEVKPGITGLWQILGRKNLLLEENIEYDFYYIKNRSLLLDIVIMFKTVIVILTGRGAY
ncbi:sugar transferase [Candidatus Peregrinibacteria bacterium]|nr:sugar transferase [Candidatus Peregrinibacteria bacterium]